MNLHITTQKETTESMKPTRQLLSLARAAWQTLPVEKRKEIRGKLHPALRARINRAFPGRNTVKDLGLLSVVVPVHNVEEYLEDCLSSIAAQSYRHLEVIVVDDGSSDGSLQLCRAFARHDKRFHVVTQPNAGLGAARNAGIRLAKGTFIAFADSDDIVPRRAYEVMMRSLEQSGSDFAVGSVTRLKGKKKELPAWARTVHRTTRTGVTLGEFPEILHDVFAWNKIFRRGFWDSEVGEFPEGVLYEDQEATARAYARATAFDVLSDVVYEWRIRLDRSSITQQKTELNDVRDRVLVARRLARFMQTLPDASVKDFWFAKVLGEDLGLYYVQVPKVSQEYWEVIRDGVLEIQARASEEMWSLLGVHDRVLLRHVLADDRAGFENVIFRLADSGRSFPLSWSGGHWEAEPDYLGLVRDDLLEPQDLVVEHKLLAASAVIQGVETAPDGTISVRGHVQLEGVAAAELTDSVFAEMADPSTGAVLPLTVLRHRDPSIDQGTSQLWASQAESGFSVEIIAGELLSLTPGSQPHLWEMRLWFQLPSGILDVPVDHRENKGRGARTAVLPLMGERRAVTVMAGKTGFGVEVLSQHRIVRDIQLNGRVLSGEFVASEGEKIAKLSVECKNLALSASTSATDKERSQRFVIVLPELPRAARGTVEQNWHVRITTTDGREHYVAVADGEESLRALTAPGNPLAVSCNARGYFELKERPQNIEACDVALDEKHALLSVVVASPWFSANSGNQESPEVVLANGRNVLAAHSTESLDAERLFRITFDLRQERWGNPAPVPESGMYTLRLLDRTPGTPDTGFWIPVSFGLEARLPLELSTAAANISLTRTPGAGALAVQFRPPFKTDERGKPMQAMLQRTIPVLSSSPVSRGTVLFESFAGKTIGDSGLGIFHELRKSGYDAPLHWVVRDHSQPVPEGAAPVIMYSREYYELLHTAEYLVNNNNFPHYFRKNPQQIYLQTWHGTPLKKIGNDIPNSGLSLSYINLMRREADYWDVLLAQNEFAGKVLPPALGFEGDALTVGYPRNDVLTGPGTEQRRAEVRSLLGLSEDQKAVLYAPTWRDNVRTSTGSYELVNHFDAAKASSLLGEEHVFLLRGHSNVADQRFTTGLRHTVDVTAYPNVADLYLAADSLVTDYSSVMFDFCVTGKPLHFLAPDLEQYRDSVRGFYFDFESVAPGPIVKDTRELAAVLVAPGPPSAAGSAYNAFRDRFAALDDGQASARVVRAVWQR